MLSEVTCKVTDHQLIPVKTGKLKHISLEGHLMLSFVNTDKDDSGFNWPNSPFSPAEEIPGPRPQLTGAKCECCMFIIQKWVKGRGKCLLNFLLVMSWPHKSAPRSQSFSLLGSPLFTIVELSSQQLLGLFLRW